MTVTLERFVDAQAPVYAAVLDELRAGKKRTHWIWFVFPQIAGLGHSETARRFAIADVEEACGFLEHPLLGPRLTQCVEHMLAWSDKLSPEAILGSLDALKFRSSMTLFEAVGGGPCFGRALDALCQSRRDEETLRLLAR